MTDRTFYFAYGSNMAIERLRARVPSARLLGTAMLAGHALRFDKPGSMDGTAKCDAACTGNAADKGVATHIGADLRPLDWYKEHVLRGARALQLPGAYIATIEAIAADIDADEARRSRELSIYTRPSPPLHER